MPKRILQGTVTSNSGDKSITVEVKRRIRHPVYKKFITRSKKYRAHDELNQCQVGQEVRIEESRPISKHKCWQVLTSELLNSRI